MGKNLVRNTLLGIPKAVVLDAMGVIYLTGDDVGELLCPFIAEKSGSTDTQLIRQIYRSASLGEISSIDFWKAVGVSPKLEDEYLAKHLLSPGLTDFLDKLKQRGIKTWCLSNDIFEWSRKLRQRFRLEDYFEGFIISSDVGFRKPDTAIFRLLIKRLAYEPHEVVFVDDHQKNLDAAKAFGFETVLFESSASIPIYTSKVVHSFAELLAFLLRTEGNINREAS
jgi:HAD superfamily hydrolase (TIGR01509 family)